MSCLVKTCGLLRSCGRRAPWADAPSASARRDPRHRGRQRTTLSIVNFTLLAHGCTTADWPTRSPGLARPLPLLEIRADTITLSACMKRSGEPMISRGANVEVEGQVADLDADLRQRQAGRVVGQAHDDEDGVVGGDLALELRVEHDAARQQRGDRLGGGAGGRLAAADVAEPAAAADTAPDAPGADAPARSARTGRAPANRRAGCAPGAPCGSARPAPRRSCLGRGSARCARAGPRGRRSGRP